MKCLLVIVVDDSLGAKTKQNETIDKINEFIEFKRHFNNSQECRLVLVKYNHEVTFMYEGTNIRKVVPLDQDDFNPSGECAFFDALHQAIAFAAAIKRQDERVLCLIITNGVDTSSTQNTSSKKTQKYVKKYNIKPDWTFAYIGKQPEFWCRQALLVVQYRNSWSGVIHKNALNKKIF